MEGMFNIFTVYSLICVFLPCLLYQLVLVYQGRKSGKHCQAVSLIWTCIFLVYVWMVYEVTGIGLLADVLRTDIPLFSGRINLKPFAEAGIGYVLNVIMCMPLGFLLPFIWKECRNIWKTVFIGTLFSVLIELSQLFNFRAFDIDDLTANILGALAGYLIWKIFTKIFGVHLKTETVELDDLELVVSTGEVRLPKKYVKGRAIAYLLLAMAGKFLLYNPYLLF